MTTVAIYNRSTAVADADIAAFLPALQKQVSEHLAKAWPGTDAALDFVVDPNARFVSDIAMVLFDDSDQAGDLGYHDVTANGSPLAKVFVKTDIEYGEDWRVTMSHEMLEVLVDPRCMWTCNTVFQGKAVTAIREVCDPVEDDRWSYDIEANGKVFKVSDFVFPSFFDPNGKAPFDFTGAIQAPMTIAARGYMSIFDGTGWQMSYGQHVPMHKKRPPYGSRRERRTVSPRRLKHSTAI